MSTALKLLGVGVSPYSARGLTQTLGDIDGAVATRRSINAVLRNTTPAGFNKFKSTISCSDHEAPAFDLLAPGSIVTVHCVVEMGVAVAVQPPDMSIWDGGIRPVVPGSARWEEGFVTYCPILVMMVQTRSVSRDEYGHVSAWSVELEEV